MSDPSIASVAYVTSSAFKQKESERFQALCKLGDGTPVQDVVRFIVRPVPIGERLLTNLESMVLSEVTEAYASVKVPCVVEHAGLVFEEYRDKDYPGGLTKPMWNSLGDKFIEETKSAGRRVVARAVVAYCDGMQCKTFVGETAGVLADAPRGSRAFYWDTVFIPNEDEGGVKGMTYSELVEDARYGLDYKIDKLSQSTKAMRLFVEYLRKHPPTELW